MSHRCAVAQGDYMHVVQLIGVCSQELVAHVFVVLGRVRARGTEGGPATSGAVGVEYIARQGDQGSQPFSTKYIPKVA